MEISLVSQEHPDDDIWEEYVFGRISQDQEAVIEEHLLVCERCQNTLASADKFVSLMQFALVRFPAHKPKHKWNILPFRDRRTATFASALTAACFLLLLWIGPFRSHLFHRTAAESASVAVSLQSYRDASAAAMNRAPAAHPLDLSVSLADVPSSAQYRIEIVTFEGRAVWSGEPGKRGRSISVHVANSLGAGMYWVRLYGSKELLAEYGLKLD